MKVFPSNENQTMIGDANLAMDQDDGRKSFINYLKHLNCSKDKKFKRQALKCVLLQDAIEGLLLKYVNKHEAMLVVVECMKKFVVCNRLNKNEMIIVATQLFLALNEPKMYKSCEKVQIVSNIELLPIKEHDRYSGELD